MSGAPDPDDFELIDGVRAIPPDGADDVELTEDPELSNDRHTRLFRKAGWRFVRDNNLPTKSYHVARDKNKRVKIIAPSMSVKFLERMSRSDVDTILRSENLKVRRKNGFSANSFVVTGDDVLAKAQRLNRKGEIEWALPTTIEPLTGRS